MNLLHLQRAIRLGLRDGGSRRRPERRVRHRSRPPGQRRDGVRHHRRDHQRRAWPCGVNVGNDLWYRYIAGRQLDRDRLDLRLELRHRRSRCSTARARRSPRSPATTTSARLQSTITFPATAGTTYYIRVGGWNAPVGVGHAPADRGCPPPPGRVTIVNNLPATWIDISATGTALNLADDASVDIATTIGNSLFAAGTARVGSNGARPLRGRRPDPRLHERRDPVRRRVRPDEPVAPRRSGTTSTRTAATVGNIYWQETQGRLIVQWQAAGFFGAAATETATFQIQVPGAGPVYAQFLYQDVAGARADSGGSATIGYQAGGVQNDVQWSFNVAGSVANGTVLSLVPGRRRRRRHELLHGERRTRRARPGSISGSGSARRSRRTT